MSLRTQWQPITIWLVVSLIAALFCSLSKNEAHIGTDYFPMGVDAFYHAHRILSAAKDPSAFYEFDPNIHAPEGSLLVWPWGYDYVLAKIVRAARAIHLGNSDLMILLWIPVVAVSLAVALLMFVGYRLSLSHWTVALATLCVALSPATQLLFGFAQVDHHFAEFLFILLTLAAGLSWFDSSRRLTSIVLGMSFALALAAHNALFVLQVPFLIALFIRWLQGLSPSRKATLIFAGALVFSTLGILIPSQPFREGRFEFYTLSWFHLYVVVCTALASVVLSYLKPSRAGIASVVLVALVLTTPLISQIRHAESFVSGNLGMLHSILEMRSPLQLIRIGDARLVTGFYSWLFWLAPLTLLICATRIWKERTQPRLLFWITSVFGLALMFAQVRMHYFGSFALYLPYLVLAQDFADKRPETHKRSMLLLSLCLLLAYIPQIRHALVAPLPRANDEWFEKLYPMLPVLRRACEEDPGVVLADGNAGHYIRYYTKCSVIANNFLLTEQHFRKYDEAVKLFSGPLQELRARAPYVKYVLVRPASVEPRPDGQIRFHFFGEEQPQAAPQLLLGRPADLPPAYQLIYQTDMEMRSMGKKRIVPYAKLFKLEERR